MVASAAVRIVTFSGRSITSEGFRSETATQFTFLKDSAASVPQIRIPSLFKSSVNCLFEFIGNFRRFLVNHNSEIGRTMKLEFFFNRFIIE